jgi:hypothetical protein
VGRELRHVLVSEEYPALLGDEESRHAPQERRLPASARAQEEEELARLDHEVQVVERGDGPEALGQFLDPD